MFILILSLVACTCASITRVSPLTAYPSNMQLPLPYKDGYVIVGGVHRSNSSVYYYNPLDNSVELLYRFPGIAKVEFAAYSSTLGYYYSTMAEDITDTILFWTKDFKSVNSITYNEGCDLLATSTVVVNSEYCLNTPLERDVHFTVDGTNWVTVDFRDQPIVQMFTFEDVLYGIGEDTDAGAPVYRVTDLQSGKLENTSYFVPAGSGRTWLSVTRCGRPEDGLCLLVQNPYNETSPFLYSSDWATWLPALPGDVTDKAPELCDACYYNGEALVQGAEGLLSFTPQTGWILKDNQPGVLAISCRTLKDSSEAFVLRPFYMQIYSTAQSKSVIPYNGLRGTPVSLIVANGSFAVEFVNGLAGWVAPKKVFSVAEPIAPLPKGARWKFVDCERIPKAERSGNVGCYIGTDGTNIIIGSYGKFQTYPMIHYSGECVGSTVEDVTLFQGAYIVSFSSFHCVHISRHRVHTTYYYDVVRGVSPLSLDSSDSFASVNSGTPQSKPRVICSNEGLIAYLDNRGLVISRDGVNFTEPVGEYLSITCGHPKGGIVLQAANETDASVLVLLRPDGSMYNMEGPRGNVQVTYTDGSPYFTLYHEYSDSRMNRIEFTEDLRVFPTVKTSPLNLTAASCAVIPGQDQDAHMCLLANGDVYSF